MRLSSPTQGFGVGSAFAPPAGLLGGYWSPQDPEKAKDMFIYILAHPSRADAEKNWNAFKVDPDWISVKAASEKNGALAKTEESTFMEPVAFSPMK